MACLGITTLVSHAADLDSDTMDDAWEVSHFGNTLRDGTGDFDEDGVPDLIEFQAGLNPTLVDSDADGRPDPVGIPGFLSTETWNNVTRSGLAAVFRSEAFLKGVPVKGFTSQSEAGQNVSDGFLVRWRGTLTAPVTGDYRLFIASDDQSQLWFGEAGGSKFTRRKVASVNGFTGYRQWTASPTQDSGLIHLEAGQSYYFEVVMQDNESLDNLSVGWMRPGQSTVEIIPGKLGDGTVVLKGYTPDPDDADDDGLPDSWELTANLNMGDNGSINPADGGYSDWDHDGLTNYEEWLTEGNPLAQGGNKGIYRRDLWTAVTGATVASLTSQTKFSQTAQSVSVTRGALKFGSAGDNYGQRVKGVIVPPHSGNYRFWIASDDASELWFSTSASRLHKQKIAYVSSWANADAFDTTPSQKSVSLFLAAGQPYYYEALHKEGASLDHLSMAWAYEPANLARQTGVVATQSTTYGGQTADRAIDGNTSGSSSSTIAHTTSTLDSWWRADFPQATTLNRVVVFNRTDALSNQQRLSNFRISVLNGSGTEIAGQNFYQGSGYVNGSLTWDLPSTVSGARAIKIQFLGYNNNGNGFMCLAEVQAFEWKPLATRQIIAADYLRSEFDEPLDADGDSLPDAWEVQYGLSATDGGASVFADGEYGDPDADGVPNLLEYVNGTSPTVPNGEPGKLQRDTWNDIAGEEIYYLETSPRFLEPADNRTTVSAWQTSSRGEYYGQRFRGSLTAPTTGWYTFWITGDNGCELSLSTNDRKFLKQRLASVMNSAPVGDFDKYPSQRSKQVYLTQGNSYFLEVRHKEVSSSDYVVAAWQQPGGVREILPFTALRSFSYDIDDVDDDDLPDSWESQWGLDPADNGRIRRGIEGALGDADGDQLTNREEFLLGTDPLNADSDGDGLSDYVESRSIGSDPNNANSGTGSAVTDQNGSQGTSVSGNWIVGPNGTFLSLDRRGAASWPFTLSAAGVKLIEVMATPQGNTWAGADLTVDIAVVRVSDSKRWTVGAFPLRDDEGAATRVLTLLPWLPAGSYKAEVTIRNISESRNVRIDRFRILDPAGVDANANGIADWVEARLAGGNGILTTASTSIVSPVCLEGITRDLGSTALTADGVGVTLSPGVDNRWFANVALPTNGTAASLAASFESGSMTQSQSVAWSPVNTLSGSTLTVRSGDSLRLTAFPGGTADSGAVTITAPGISISTTADVPIVRKFEYKNVALASAGATATQSSEYPGGNGPGRAIDGDISGTTFSHTNNVTNSWWQVDLGQDRLVGRVVLFNRDNFQNRLSNFRVSVLNAAGTEISGENFFVGSGNVAASMVWNLTAPVTGRKVKVALLGTNNLGNGLLTLSEVEVYPPDQYTLAATHTDAGSAVTTGNTLVKVVAADFGPDLQVRTNRWRDWLTKVPATLPLDLDASLKIADLGPLHGYHRLNVSTTSDKPVNLVARSQAAGTIAAKGTIDPFLIGDAYESGYVEILDTLPDGVILGRISVVADRLPPGGYVEIQIWAGGAQFGNGTGILRLYSSDFDANGVALVNVYYPSNAAISSFCAYYRLKDATGKLLSDY